VLRPSILPSLLACRRANQDGGVGSGLVGAAGVRLYEMASAFAEKDGPGRESVERRQLAMLIDVPAVGAGKPGTVDERQGGVRAMRGAVEAAAKVVAGGAAIDVRPGAPVTPAYEAGAYAEVLVGGIPVGRFGLIGTGTQRLFELAIPVAAAELDLEALVRMYPPKARAEALPAFPSIERDLSLVVDESVAWDRVWGLVEGLRLERLEGVSFIGTYRGKQAGPGKKSVTLRMRFRDPSRTLRHEEVDPQVAAVVQQAGERLGAALRA